MVEVRGFTNNSVHSCGNLKVFVDDGELTRNINKKKKPGVYKLITGVYSSTNWLPFTRGQNSILNWVLRLNPILQKIKKLIKIIKSLYSPVSNNGVLIEGSNRL